MSEENKGIASNILSRLRGVGVGGASVSKEQSQQAQATSSNMSQKQEKPKRDIQELYDFIDAYCNKSEE